MLAAKPHALDVDRLREIPDLLRRVDSISVVGMHDAGIVEEDIQAAPGVNVLDHSLDVGFFGDIGDFGIELLGVWDDGFELLEGLF
jgi:hypothetical protein